MGLNMVNKAPFRIPWRSSCYSHVPRCRILAEFVWKPFLFAATIKHTWSIHSLGINLNLWDIGCKCDVMKKRKNMKKNLNFAGKLYPRKKCWFAVDATKVTIHFAQSLWQTQQRNSAGSVRLVSIRVDRNNLQWKVGPILYLCLRCMYKTHLTPVL